MRNWDMGGRGGSEGGPSKVGEDSGGDVDDGTIVSTRDAPL